jgi:hypothetical protein
MYLNLTDEGISALSVPRHQDMFAFQVVKHESNLEIQRDIAKTCHAIDILTPLSKPVLAGGDSE